MKHLRPRPPLLLAAMVTAIAATPAIPHAEPDQEVERVLRKFRHEPSVREVQVAAIEYYQVSPKEIQSLRSRARKKAWIPGLSIGFANSVESYERALDDIVFRTAGIAEYEDQNKDFLGYNISLSWRLDRLYFNAEELDVLSLIGIQDGIQREVTSLYYVRRRLQIQQLLNPPKSLAARISAKLRIEELSGLLDAYTGGFFTRTTRKNR